MSIGSQQYAGLADHVYGEELNGKKGQLQHLVGEEITSEGVTYKVLEYMDKPSGYQGAIYQRKDTGEIVVAHRGTEFDREAIKDGLKADGGMLTARANAQADDAIELTRRALTLSKELAPKYGHALEVTVTGHSLGGCLAQITAHHFDLKGETFNPYGAASLDRRIPTGYDNVLNHVMAGDAVSASSPHFGQVKVYATPKEITTFTAMGYDNNRNPLDARAPLPAAIASGYLGSHYMDNFVNVDAEGRPDVSVLRNPKAQQLAEQFDPMIDKFRSDIGVARGGITVIGRDPVGRLKDGLDWIRGPLEPGEPAAREERAAAAAARQESREIPRRFGPLYPRAPAEAPYVPEVLKPNGGLSPLPDYLDPGNRTQIPMKPAGGSNSVSLNDNPSAFLDRMLAAAQSGDRDTFRHLTQTAADAEPGRALRAEAVATVDRQEQVALQQLAQQQLEQQATVARSGPRMV